MVFYSDHRIGREGFNATWRIGRGEQCCPAHSTAPPGALSLQECVCDAGFEDTDLGSETVCTACGPGSYKAFAGAGACSSCPAGKFKSTEEDTECVACSANKTTVLEGSTSESANRNQRTFDTCPATSFHVVPVA